MTDKLADVLEDARTGTHFNEEDGSTGVHFNDGAHLARLAREFIAAEIEKQAQPFRLRPDGTIEAPEDYVGLLTAARIARGETE